MLALEPAASVASLAHRACEAAVVCVVPFALCGSSLHNGQRLAEPGAENPKWRKNAGKEEPLSLNPFSPLSQ